MTDGNNAVPEERGNRDHTDSPMFLGTAGTQAQALLKALNDFVVPIIDIQVQGAAAKSAEGNTEEAYQNFMTSEAKEFLVALHKFIVATFGHRKGIKVDLENNTILNEEVPPPNQPLLEEATVICEVEGENNEPKTNDEISPDIIVASNEHSPRGRTTTVGYLRASVNGIPKRIEQQELPDFLRSQIRQHVFNNMPIRLLSFESRAGNIEISLLEKEEIIEHITTKVQADFDESRPWGSEEVLKYARYAILSHTWIHGGSGEVTYEDWNKGVFAASQPGFQKLLNFCKVAEQDHGVTLGWMDTICINKESSAELDESIRSMYKWYRDASICVTYLARTSILSDMRKDPWFTRGWTLQELLAPQRLKFYTSSWEKLVLDENDKSNRLLHYEIELATSITSDEIRNFRPDARSNDINDSSVSRRMQWAANRRVTREEDIAYSLMGIFDVSISIAYGEGPRRAFFRLLKKILTSSTHVSDIFNWAGSLPESGGRTPSSLLPSSPQHYLHRSNTLLTRNAWSGEPTTLTHLGLRIQILLAPAILTNYPAFPYTPIGDYSATVQISQCADVFHGQTASESNYSGPYHLLDNNLFLGKDLPDGVKRLTFGILNFWEYATDIQLSSTSLAMALTCSEDPGRVTAQGRTEKIHTEKPIVFSFGHRKRSPLNQIIAKSELATHGMQLLTLYL